MDEKDVRAANERVSGHIAAERLKKIRPDPLASRILLINSRESLDVAATVTSALWTIVCSYYAMFYAANAVLNEFGWKVGAEHAHLTTADALTVFIRPKLRDSLMDDFQDGQAALALIRADELTESFLYERRKRSTFQYSTSELAMASKARTSSERAKIFVMEMEKLLR